MKLCSLCNQYFDDIQGICPIDRTPLETVENDRLIGALICDRYVIDSVIGKGASGIVYKARRMQRGDVVAIKVLHNQLGAEGNSLDRFLREAIAASKLRNPHIITIWDSGVTDDGQPFFVMDYLEGITLGRLIKETSHLPYDRVLSILKQVTDALGEAHKQGIIHRDLKPENIILQVTDAGQDFVKVLDFGVSDLPAESARVDKPKSVAGSPAYMSPEQCQGFQLDARSDIYSLGIIIFELLTGRRPFRVDDYVSLMFLHVSEPPMKLADARPEINYPPELQTVITKALAKVPSQRQASVEELYQELEAAIAGAEQTQISLQGASGQFAFPLTADNGHSQIDNQNTTSARNDTADMEPISVTQTELTLGAGSSGNLEPVPNQPMPSNPASKSNLRNVFKEQIEEEEQAKSKPKPPKAKSSIAGIASPFKAMAMATQTLVGFAVPALKPKGKEGTEAPQSIADVIDLGNALNETPVQEAPSTPDAPRSKNPSKHSLPAMGLNGLLSVLESRPLTPPPVPDAAGPKSLSDLLKNGRRTGSNTAIPPQTAPAAQSVSPSTGYSPQQEQFGAFPNTNQAPNGFEIPQSTSGQAFGNNTPTTPQAPELAGGNGQSTQRPLKFTATKQDMLAPQRIEPRREESATAPIELPPAIEPVAIEPQIAAETNTWPAEISAMPLDETAPPETIQSTAPEPEVLQQNFAPYSVEPAELSLASPEVALDANLPADAASEPIMPEVSQTNSVQSPLNKVTTTGGQPRKSVAPLVRQSQANPPANTPTAKNDGRSAGVSPDMQKRTQEMVVNSLNSLASQYQQKAGDNPGVKQSGAYGVRQSSSFPKPTSPIKQSGAFPKEGGTKQSGAFAKDGPVRQSGAFAKDGPVKQSGAFAKDGPVKQSGAFSKENPLKQSGAFSKLSGSSSVRQSGSFLPSSEQRFLAAAPYSTSKPAEGSIARMIDEVDVAPQSEPALEVNAGTVVFEHDPASLQDLGAAAWGHFTSDESEAPAEAAAFAETAPQATPENVGAYFEDEVSSLLTQPDVVPTPLPEVPLPEVPAPPAAPIQIEFAEESPAVNDFVQPAIPASPPAGPSLAPQPKANVKPQSPFQGMEQAHRTSRLPASDVEALKAAAKEPPKPGKPSDTKPDESISDMLIALSIDHDPAALEQPPGLLDQDPTEGALPLTVLEQKPSGQAAQAHESLSAAAAAARAAQSETTPEIMPKPRKSPYVTIGESDSTTPAGQPISTPAATPQKESLKDLLAFDTPNEAPKALAEETPKASPPTPQSTKPPEFPKQAQTTSAVKPQQTPETPPAKEAVQSPEVSQGTAAFEAVTSAEIPKVQPGADTVTSTEVAQVPPKVAKSLELMPKTPDSLIDFFKEDTFKPPGASQQITPVHREPTPLELYAYEPNRAQMVQPPAEELPPESPTGAPGDLSKLLDSLESVGKERPAKQQGTPIDLPAFGIGKPSEAKQPASPVFDEVTLQEQIPQQQQAFELTQPVIPPEPVDFEPKLQDESPMNEAKSTKNNAGPGLNRLIEAAKRGPTSSKMQKSAAAKPSQNSKPAPAPAPSQSPQKPVDTSAGMFSQPSSFNNQAPSQNVPQSMSKSGTQSRSVREMMEGAGSNIKQEITGGFNHFNVEGGGDNFAQSAAALAAATGVDINRVPTGNPASPSGRAPAGKDVGGISLILPPPAEFMSMEAPIHPKPSQPVYTDADYENLNSAQASEVVKQKYEAQLARKKGKTTDAWNETVATTRNRTASLRTKPGGMNWANTFLIGAITIAIAYVCVSVVIHMTQNNKAFAPTPVKPIKTLLQNKEYEQVRKILEKKQETATLTKQDNDDLDTAYVNIAKDGVKAKKYEIAMTVAQKIGPKSARFNEASKLLRQIKRLKKAQGKRSSG